MDKKNESVLKITISIIVACLIVLYFGVSKNIAFQSFSMSWSFAAIGLISFFGLFFISLLLENGESDGNDKFKNAIAGALIIMYIHLMSVYIFDDIVTAETEETKYIISNFTNLVSVVVVSYFGASAIDTYSKNKVNKED